MIDHLEALFEAQTIEQIWRLHLGKMASFGFDRLIYGFTRFRTTNSFGSLDDILVLSNHSKAFLDGFVGQGLYHHAPMVRWAAENVGACSWRWIDEQARSGHFTPSELKVMEFNIRQGVRAGYSISFKDVSVRSKGAIGLAARDGISQAQVEDIWAENGREIVIVNNVTHLRITSMPYGQRARSLTKRQREALEWVGDGKTTQDIATIMGLTPATVEKHLRLARDALDVDTTTQAVLKASFQNQIFMIQA